MYMYIETASVNNDDSPKSFFFTLLSIFAASCDPVFTNLPAHKIPNLHIIYHICK